jgi:hypothetical protein
MTTQTRGLPVSSVLSSTWTRNTTSGSLARARAHSRSIISHFSVSVSVRSMCRMTFTGGGDSARPSSSGRFKRAAEVPPRRGAEIGRDFVVGQLVCDPQAQLGLRAQICGVLHGRFSKSASIGPVAFDWTWMSKSLLNVPTALLCKAAFAGAPFDLRLLRLSRK